MSGLRILQQRGMAVRQTQNEFPLSDGAAVTPDSSSMSVPLSPRFVNPEEKGRPIFGDSEEDATADAPRLRVKLWVELDGANAFGLGSAMLLRGVVDAGSLVGAAKAIGMSYRAAWDRVRKIEARLGRPVVEKLGGNKAGYSLTSEGVALLYAYERMYHRVQAVACEEFEACFEEMFPGMRHRE